jgi:hypothetical protein
MIHLRIAALPTAVLALAGWFHASGQSVVSTHAGVIYFFEGSVFLEDQPLEQKFGKFPDVGEGRALRTERGRAEVLLTPGVFLRIGDNSAIRMLSNKLSDTQVALLGGSAILESKDAGADTSVKLIYKNWQVRVPQHGVYRIDFEPAQLQVYKGEVEVLNGDQADPVSVKAGETLPLATLLVPEQSTAGSDAFKNWAMNRSQAISADNAIAAGIVDDPSQLDSAGLAAGGFSYFPTTGIPALGITNPYGVSFWSPYQSALSSMYASPYMYGGLYSGWPGGVPYGVPYYGLRFVTPSRITVAPRHGVIFSPRPPASPSTGIGIHGAAPHIGVHAGHR